MVVLYLLSYSGLLNQHRYIFNTLFSKNTSQTLDLLKNRAGDEIRTRDPQLGRLMLYQLSYSRLCFTLNF
jgi:hypothetical protein